MYLNTKSGLSQIFEAAGDAYGANARNDAQTRALVKAQILPQSDMPQPGVFGGILSKLGIGGQPDAAPPAMPQATTAPAAKPPAGLPTFAAAGAPPTANHQDFINTMMPHALAISKQTGIDPRIVIAQSAVETGWGAHAPGNNYFGVKGKGQNLATHEVVNGQDTPVMASFSAYPDMASSAQGYADFINKNPRYAELKSSQGLGPQIAALGRSGYATDPNYATKVGFIAGGIKTPEGLDTTPTASVPGASGGGSPPSAGGPPPASMTEAIQALVREPSTREYGMKLWEQSVTGKNYGFQVLPDGTVLRTDSRGGSAVPIYHGATKGVIAPAGSELLDPTTGRVMHAAPGKLELKEIGTDAMGNKSFGLLNPQTGEIKPVATPNGAAAAGAPDPNLHGDDYLATLNPTIAAQVKAYATGRSKMPSGMGANSPFARQMRAAVLQYDPNFDATNTDARFKTRTSFSPGGGPSTAGSAITAGNTAIQHLGRLYEAAAKLGNADSGLPGNNTYNWAKNVLARNTGREGTTEFDNIVSKYVEEATKFYRGTGGTEADIKRDLGNLSSDMSPTQLRAAIRANVELMQSKINALQSTWHQGMGPNEPDFPIIQPKSQEALNRIEKDEAPPGAAAPAPGARQAPDGHWYVADPARPGKFLQVQ